MKTMDPMEIFLMETIVACDVVSHVMNKIGFSYFLSVPPIGWRGGHVFCWRLDFRFQLLWQSHNIIHLEVDPGGDNLDFSLFSGLWTGGLDR